MFKKILIVGFGSIGKKHLSVIQDSLPSAEKLVFKRSSPISEQIPGVSFTNNDEKAVSFRPEIAVIANPAPFHIEIATKLAKNGCHLLIEKPVTVVDADAKSLMEEIRSKGVVCQVGYNLRYFQSLRNFKNLIDEELIGKVYSIRCEVGQYLPSWRPGTDYRAGVSAQKYLGGGVLNELSHEIDYLQWIFGEINWVRGWSGKVSDLEIDVEDLASITMGLKHSSASEESIATLSLDFIRHDRTRHCTVIGSEGTLKWDGTDGSVLLFRRDSSGWENLYSSSDEVGKSYHLQWQDFINCIKNNTSPMVNLKVATQVVKIVGMIRSTSF